MIQPRAINTINSSFAGRAGDNSMGTKRLTTWARWRFKTETLGWDWTRGSARVAPTWYDVVHEAASLRSSEAEHCLSEAVP